MLNESNSSFDTTPSYDFILRYVDDFQNDAIDVINDVADDDDDEAEYDVVDDMNEVHEEDAVGVLIVPPTSNSSGNSHDTELSIPDTVPSVLNGSEILPPLPASVHIVNNEEDHVASPLANDALLQVTENGRAQEDDIPVTRRPRYDERDGLAAIPPRRRNTVTFLFCLVVSAASMSHALFLYRESQSLKEKIRLLEDQVNRTAATMLELEQQQRKQDQEQTVMFMDTCWIQAQAKMSFGDCSYEASDAVKAQVSTLGSSVRYVWEHIKSIYDDPLQGQNANHSRMFSSETINATVWSVSNKISNQVDKMTNRTQVLWNRVKGSLNETNVNGRFGDTTGFRNTMEVVWDRIKPLVFDIGSDDEGENITEKISDMKRSILDPLKRGYQELKELFTVPSLLMNDTVFNMTSDFNDTSNAKDVNSTSSSSTVSTYVQTVKDCLPSVSKKVMVAAFWSVGAAVLVSTLEMYWNQQSGKVLSIEN